MANKREYFAKFGIATKGLVYILIGGLTAMTTLGIGGKETGSMGALKYVAKQSYGQLLLGLIVIGLAGYVFWRFYQTFTNTENDDEGVKGTFKKIGYFFSGLFYGYLAYTAITIVTNANSGSASGKTLLDSTVGQVVLVVIALGLLFKALYQIYLAYSGKFKERIQSAGLDSKTQKLLIRSGQFGLTTRGIVIGITVFLIFRGIVHQGQSNIAGKAQAFEFLQGNFGSLILIVASVGLIAYGVYMVIKSKYARQLITSS